jgi:hypothetical protein
MTVPFKAPPDFISTMITCVGVLPNFSPMGTVQHRAAVWLRTVVP